MEICVRPTVQQPNLPHTEEAILYYYYRHVHPAAADSRAFQIQVSSTESLNAIVPVIHMPAITIPLEIKETILELLAEDDEGHLALKMCSLVCQTFLPICRKHHQENRKILI